MGHGVTITEVPTGVKPAVSVTAGLPVYTGTAPINLGDETAVNKPVVCYSLAEFEAKFGKLQPSTKWADYTLHEAAAAHFRDYGVGPIVCINVLDPANSAHYVAEVDQAHVLDSDGNATIEVYGDEAPTFGVLKSSVVVKVSGSTKALGTDYTLAFDDDGYLVVSRVSSGSISSGAHITVSFHYFDPSAVTSADIIGGYTGGAYTGLECVEQVYPRLRLVPGLILSPKWSQTPTVAARMAAIAHSVNGSFRAMAVVDLSTDPEEIPTYADAPAWKSDNGYGVDDVVACWPKVKSGSDVFHASTVAACVMGVTDAARNGVPYASPSNQAVVGTSAVLDDGTEVLLTRPQANSLNDQGIVTVLNGFYGWRLWGNRTAVYPSTTDVKDSMIPVRRMFNWIGNTTVLTTDRDVDQPGNKRLIEGVVGTQQSFLNGLVAQEALVAGRIEFRKDENPTTDLSDGKVRFHHTLTPPSPAEDIEFITEYDPAALAALFA